eukprot:m.139084 g.139084  ORF g.139084 m.139084 type:complete len:390 (-) comp20295_c0_seq11:56-1225(-)
MSCTICFIDYDEDVHVPHVLSCGHSLCGICLAFLPRRLCPNCSAPCGDNPPKNFSLLHILSQAPRPKIPDPHTMCKTHSEPLRFFDLVCDKLLCCDCFAVDHAGHQCLKIDEAAKAAAPEVKSLKEIARASASDVAQAEAKLERFLRDVEEKKKTLAASITETFAKVKATVQQRERALLLQLDIAALECSKLITKQKKKLKEVRGSLEASVAVPDQTSHAQLLQSRAHLLNTLETLKSAPPQLVPAHDGNLTFTHTLDEVHKSLSAFGAVSSGSPAKPSITSAKSKQPFHKSHFSPTLQTPGARTKLLSARTSFAKVAARDTVPSDQHGKTNSLSARGLCASAAARFTLPSDQELGRLLHWSKEDSELQQRIQMANNEDRAIKRAKGLL